MIRSLFANKEKSLKIEIEEYVFNISSLMTVPNGEAFLISLNDDEQEMIFAIAEKTKKKFFNALLSNPQKEQVIEKLNENTDLLNELYLAIRNHPSCRIKLMNTFGPIKE